MLTLAAVFVLVDRNAVRELDLSLFKVNSPTFILFPIPVVLSYLAFSTASSVADLDYLSRAYWTAFEKDYSDTPSHERFYRVALAPGSGVFSALVRMDYRAANGLERVASFGNYFKATVALLWPVAFVAYAGNRLNNRFGAQNALAWISIVVAVLMIVFSFVTLLAAPSSPIETRASGDQEDDLNGKRQRPG